MVQNFKESGEKLTKENENLAEENQQSLKIIKTLRVRVTTLDNCKENYREWNKTIVTDAEIEIEESFNCKKCEFEADYVYDLFEILVFKQMWRQHYCMQILWNKSFKQKVT